uniref:Uncharacterized protein n=1 Tax=Arundo donax TaxID=35708 RepID=A0A0A9APR2_ARUDO
MFCICNAIFTAHLSELRIRSPQI